MSLAVPTSAEFPVLAREGLVYLDTAATSQTVRASLEAMDRYYQTYRASIHRGVYPIAAQATGSNIQAGSTKTNPGPVTTWTKRPVSRCSIDSTRRAWPCRGCQRY